MSPVVFPVCAPWLAGTEFVTRHRVFILTMLSGPIGATWVLGHFLNVVQMHTKSKPVSCIAVIKYKTVFHKT